MPHPEQPYPLDVDDTEIERLGSQHRAWAPEARRLWSRAGFGSGDRILDLGCGPGHVAFELAELVGPDGRVVCVDREARFVAYVEREAARRRLGRLGASLASAETFEIDGGPLDGCYTRWLLSWVADPALVLARVAERLRPGGAIAMHEYLDWGAMSLVPDDARFDRAVRACLERWRHVAPHIDVTRELPTTAAGLGLSLEWFEPLGFLAPVGSPKWGWIDGFWRAYLPGLVAEGLLSDAEAQACKAALAEVAASGSGYCLTPTMAAAVLKKPAE